jgi:hypothetical protein
MVRVSTNQLMMNILCVVRGDTNHGGVIPYFNCIGVDTNHGEKFLKALLRNVLIIFPFL